MKTIAYLLGASADRGRGDLSAGAGGLLARLSFRAMRPGSRASRMKHGLAAGAVGIILLVVGWVLGRRNSSHQRRFRGAAERDRVEQLLARERLAQTAGRAELHGGAEEVLSTKPLPAA